MGSFFFLIEKTEEQQNIEQQNRRKVKFVDVCVIPYIGKVKFIG